MVTQNAVPQVLEIPAPILSGAVAILSPYRPGLSTERLAEALARTDASGEIPRETLRTRDEAIIDLRISMPTLDRMISAGRLDSVKVGRRVLIRESSIRKIIDGAA